MYHGFRLVNNHGHCSGLIIRAHLQVGRDIEQIFILTMTTMAGEIGESKNKGNIWQRVGQDYRTERRRLGSITGEYSKGGRVG